MALRAATNRMMPTWWTGAAPLATAQYVIDCTHFGPALKGEPLPSDLVHQMRATFDSKGVVLLRNTGLDGDMAAMGKIAALAMGGSEHYEGGANPRNRVADNVFDVGAPASAHLHMHHEMAYIDESVAALGFSCSAAPGQDLLGATFLSDNVAVTDDILQTEVGKKLKERGVSYIRCLTDRDNTPPDAGVYNHWQQSFLTDDPDEALEKAASKGLIAEFGPGRYMRTVCKISAFEYFPHLNRNLLFSSVADDGVWFDAWPGVAELPPLSSFKTATPAERPLKMTYGDGSEISADELEEFMRVYDRHGFPVAWQSGDILVFCNYRFAHGRPAYELEEGMERTIGVTLGKKFKRVGDLADKW